MIKFTIITLFPEALEPYLRSSMLWKAQDRGIAEYDFVNLREFGLGPHRSVDDTPYGGGDGMLMRCEPVFAAIESVKAKDPTAEVIVPTPSGRFWKQELAREFAGVDANGQYLATSADGEPLPRHYIIFCPHYEGFDERIKTIIDHEICLGPYILTGGELPALIMIDSIVRLLPNVLGGETSALVESFSDGNNLEYPQYTKPYDFRGMTVPDILLSGNHGEIKKWRDANSKTADF